MGAVTEVDHRYSQIAMSVGRATRSRSLLTTGGPSGRDTAKGVPVLIRRTRGSGDCSADLNNLKIKEVPTETSEEASSPDHQ